MEIPFTTIEIGTSSGIEDSQNQVLRSTQEWTNLWSTHTSLHDPSPPPPLPLPLHNIDFTTSLIISVFRGTQSTGGYSIEIVSVQEIEDRIVVTYEIEDPDPFGMTMMMMTQPFHMIEIPFTTKEVEFVCVDAPPPPPRFPEFFVMLDDKEQSEKIHTIMDELQEMENVSDIHKGSVFIIRFHSDKISKEDALKLLEEKLKDVTSTIEADPPVSSW